MLAGPDTDGWNADCLCNLLRNFRDHNLDHDRKRTGFFYGARIGNQRFRFRLSTTLDPIAAFLVISGVFLVTRILGWYVGNVILWMRNKRS